VHLWFVSSCVYWFVGVWVCLCVIAFGRLRVCLCCLFLWVSVCVWGGGGLIRSFNGFANNGFTYILNKLQKVYKN
jgi:hypothetical protein